MEAKVLKDTTQSILGYPRIAAVNAWLRAQPTSATVRVATPSTSMPAIADAEAATVDALATTLAAAAADGATSLTLAGAVALKRGRRYLVADGAGSFIEVESRTEGNSATMKLAEPLPRALDNAAAVKGFAVSHALTADETDVVGECLALWKAIVDGVAYEWSQTFRVVARMPVCTLTPTKLTKAYPSIRPLKTRNDETFEETIEIAWEYLVYPLLAKHDLDDEDILSWETLEPLTALACLYQRSLDNPKVTPEQFEKVEARWNLEKKEFFARKDLFTAPQDDVPAAPTQKPSPAPLRRLVR